MNFSRSTQKTIVLSLTLLAFLLRLYRLEAQSYWIDEAWTLFYTRHTFPELINLLQVKDPKPPFYYVTIFSWIKLMGDGEFALRFLSAAIGVTTVGLTYRLGRALGDVRLGLLTALLVTVAPYQIWHGQDARMYSFLTAAATLSIWSFVKLWRQGGWRWWLLYVFGTSWTLWIHYHGLIVIGIQGLFLLLTWRRHWRGYLAWAATLLLVLLLLVPWLIFGSTLLQNFLHWIEQPTLWETFTRGATAYSVGELVPPDQALPLVLFFVALYGLGLLYAATRRWGNWPGPVVLALLLAWTIAPNIAAWLYGFLKTPVYLERYLIPVQIGFLLTVSAGLLAVIDGLPALLARLQAAPQPLLRRWLGLLAGLLLLLLVLGIDAWVLRHHYLNPAYAKPNWRGLIETIDTFSLSGDAILLTGDGGEKLFAYYYQGDLPVYYDFNTPVPPPAEARQRLAELAASHRRLWYTPYGVKIDAVLESWLAEQAYPAWHSWLGRKRLALYQTQADLSRREAPNQLLADPSGRGPRLLTVMLPDKPLAAGDLLPLQLTWQTESPLSQDYQLSLRLANPLGDIFAQSDWPPLAPAGPTSAWPVGQPLTDQRSLWLPPDTPPGDYLLQLVLYEPASGQSLGQPVTLANIAVAPAQLVVPPAALAIPNPTRHALNGLTLVGYALPEQIQPGRELWLWLYWQAERPPAAGALHLSLQDPSGVTPIEQRYPLAESLGPLDSWQPGQVRRAIYHLSTSPRLAGASATVRVALLAEGSPPAEIELAQLQLDNRDRQFEPPRMNRPVEVAFGRTPFLRLIGYDLPAPTPSPGNSLALTLYWQAAAEMETDYTVFVQLLNPANEVVAQVDRQPQAGAAPTTTWLPGEILTDSYQLPLPAELPPGQYRLIAGLYDAATGARLPVATGDFVELETLEIQ